MEMFYASDVPVQVRTLLEEALTAAANEWGNYGPLEYWVAGIDVTAAEELADQYCTRRFDRFEMDKSECLQYDQTVKLFPELAAAAAESIETGRPSSNAARIGARHWGIHLFSSSYPFGFAGLLGVPFADDQTVAFHEYFHAVQTAHIFTHDWDAPGGRIDGSNHEGQPETVTARLNQRPRAHTGTVWRASRKGSSPDQVTLSPHQRTGVPTSR